MAPRLPVVSGREAVGAFERAGWQVLRQRGSHIAMRKEDALRPLVIPTHRELRPGTLRGLIREAGLTVEQFIELLRR